MYFLLTQVSLRNNALDILSYEHQLSLSARMLNSKVHEKEQQAQDEVTIKL